MKGGTPYGRFTIHRRAGPPNGVPGFDQRDSRRVSAAGPALRGGVPSASGGVAPRWETSNRPPVYGVQELPLSCNGPQMSFFRINATGLTKLQRHTADPAAEKTRLRAFILRLG